MFGRKASRKHIAQRKFVLSVFSATDPILNLSLEHQLFSQYGTDRGEELLSFYINGKAVVFGKHQNPWKECSYELFFQSDVPLLRRQSGGGTVFHDRGNVNWSFIGSREEFSQEENLMIIAGMAAEYSGLPAEDFSISDRGDILCRGKKISGNALAFRGDKVLHHGTLLVDSDITELGGSLRGLEKRFPISIEGPGVDSNPMEVTTLALESGRTLSARGFRDFCGGWDELNILHRDRTDYDDNAGEYSPIAVRADAEVLEQYRSQDWHLRRTPKFRIILDEDNQIFVENAVARLRGHKEKGIEESWDLCDQRDFIAFIEFISAGAESRNIIDTGVDRSINSD